MDPTANVREQWSLHAQAVEQGRLRPHEVARVRELRTALHDWIRGGGSPSGSPPPALADWSNLGVAL